jgi:hypothetical protein
MMRKARKVFEVWCSHFGGKPHRVGIWVKREKAELVREVQDKRLNEYSSPLRRWVVWIEAKKIGDRNDKLNEALARELSRRGAITADANDEWGGTSKGSLAQSAAGPGGVDCRGRSIYEA